MEMTENASNDDIAEETKDVQGNGSVPRDDDGALLHE